MICSISSWSQGCPTGWRTLAICTLKGPRYLTALWCRCWSEQRLWGWASTDSSWCRFCWSCCCWAKEFWGGAATGSWTVIGYRCRSDRSSRSGPTIFVFVRERWCCQRLAQMAGWKYATLCRHELRRMRRRDRHHLIEGITLLGTSPGRSVVVPSSFSPWSP